ncbi:tyrosine-type recombinase/integrase [Mannheimia haemolytica]|uniref:tyrosine-type recombinase/integrase n=1 Tax=Mannheimia haemolytica TaxID=75985 RepID=UPI0013764D1D|nr:tyrosine-type recombinase/integrase [Mannheimia haemolytica]
MRIIKPLTAGQIEAAKFVRAAYRLYDGGGLFLQVGKISKTWYFAYKRPYTKKAATLRLGEYPYLTLTQARKLREDYKSDLAIDIDPQDKMEAKAAEIIAKEENTFHNVYLKWYELKKNKVKPVTMKGYCSMYKKHIEPHFKNKPIEDITIPIVLEKLEVFDKDEQSKHIVRILNFMQQVSAFATIIGVIKYNPLADLGKVPIYYANVEHRLTIPPQELPELMKALFEGQSLIMSKFAFMWQLLTMVRPSEAIAAEWEEIDLDAKTWTIPPHKMKGKRGKEKGHTVALSEQTIQLLQEIYRFSGRTNFLFPSVRFKGLRSRGKCLSGNTTLKVIYEIGYKDKLTAHGLRSIASTYLNEIGENSDLIEACLAHTVGGYVRNAYNRTDFLERRRLVMQKWADYISSCINGDLIERIYKGNQ